MQGAIQVLGFTFLTFICTFSTLLLLLLLSQTTGIANACVMRSLVIRRAIGRRAASGAQSELVIDLFAWCANNVRPPAKAPTPARLRRPIQRGRYGTGTRRCEVARRPPASANRARRGPDFHENTNQK